MPKTSPEEFSFFEKIAQATFPIQIYKMGSWKFRSQSCHVEVLVLRLISSDSEPLQQKVFTSDKFPNFQIIQLQFMMLQIRLSIAIHLVCVRCVLDTVRSCAKATCFSRSMARGCLSPSSIAADSHQAMRFIAWIAIINSSINRFVNSRRISILASVQMRRSLDTSKLRNSTTKLDAPKHNNERRQRKTTTKDYNEDDNKNDAYYLSPIGPLI